MDRKGERGGEQRGERGEQRGHSSSMIGQLFWYLVAAQLKRYQVVRHTDTPVTPSYLASILRTSMYVKNGM